MGIDWGCLFQERDLIRRRTSAINYDMMLIIPMKWRRLDLCSLPFVSLRVLP